MASVIFQQKNKRSAIAKMRRMIETSKFYGGRGVKLHTEYACIYAYIDTACSDEEIFFIKLVSNCWDKESLEQAYKTNFKQIR